MVKDRSVVKDMTKYLSANLSCFIRFAVVAFFLICSLPQTLSAEIFYTDTEAYARDIESESERQKLKKHILVIISQPYLTDWFNTLNNSLRKNLFSVLSSGSKLSYEYIGSESLTDADYVLKLTDLLHKKYARIKPDMVVAVLPASCQYILDYNELLFPGTPAVFVLPSKRQISGIAGRPQSGLVKSTIDAIPGTIERIRVLLPETERLVVVYGSDAAALNYRKIAEESLKRKGWPKTVEYLEGLPVEDLAVRLEHLPGKSAVLMLTYLHDRNGLPLTTVQVVKAVATHTAAPIFGFYDTVFGLGIVGGKLTNAEAYGDAIAETVLKMFKAGRASPLIETVADARDIYDWRQIQKWQIQQNRLPAKSEIRFKQITFWEEHLCKIILVAGIIILQALLILALLFNLARRKHAEEALRESAKKYREIFDNAVMGIYRSTPAGRFLSVNPAFAEIFGYATPDELTESIHDIQQDVYVNPADRERFKKLFEEEGVVRRFQAEFRRRDGSRFWISINGKAVRDENGNIRYYEGTIEDVTKQKRDEAELRKYREGLEDLVAERTAQLEIAKTKAESADRLKSAFLATMSHELRTPLNSIIGFTGILIQRLVGTLNEEQDKQLNMVFTSAKHLLDLINDVLDISKIEADQINIVFENFDLRSTIEKVIKSSQPLADKKGLNLSAEIAPEVGVIKSDRRRVEQILLNLISNAIKFTEQGFVKIEGQMTEGKIIIAVKDSGIGIKPEDMGILFNAFRQIECGLTRKYEGTGLGLSISKKLAHMLGGEILVESDWGAGSTFKFILPIEGKSV